MSEAVIIIDVGGRLQFVYDDDLAELLDLGDSRIRRASHVEPDAAGRWTADLAPSGGPVLGPFARRAEAIGAEVTWLQERIGR